MPFRVRRPRRRSPGGWIAPARPGAERDGAGFWLAVLGAASAAARATAEPGPGGEPLRAGGATAPGSRRDGG